MVGDQTVSAKGSATEAARTAAQARRGAAQEPVDNETPLVIPKPSGFSLEGFRSTAADTVAGVEALQTGLPVHSIAAAKDFVRLHPNEAEYWSPELCFVQVPIQGQKGDTLHLINEKLAMKYLPSARIQRFRLALASKPGDVFFLAIVPTRKPRQPVEPEQLAGL